MSAGLRQCPHCATLIAASAARCRHCGAELAAPPSSTPIKPIVWIGLALVILAAVILALVAYS